jgi:hypothetical protein
MIIDMFELSIPLVHQEVQFSNAVYLYSLRRHSPFAAPAVSTNENEIGCSSDLCSFTYVVCLKSKCTVFPMDELVM